MRGRARRRPMSGRGLSYNSTTGKLSRSSTTPSSSPSTSTEDNKKKDFCATTVEKLSKPK